MSRWMSSSTPKQNSRRHKKGGPWGRPSIPRLNLEPSNLSRLVWVDFRGCLWISPACWLTRLPSESPGGMAEQMLSIRVRDVRPLVEVNQQTIRLTQMAALLPSYGVGGAVAAWGLKRLRP